MRYGIVLDIETTSYLAKQTRYYDDNGKEVPASLVPADRRHLYRTEDGLADYADILSVGYLRVDLEDMKIFDAGTLYFYQPQFNVESKAQEVHGLKREFLEQFEDQFQDNLAMLEALITNSVIIGKNSDVFDIPFISLFLQKHRPGGGGTLYSFINTLGMKDYNGRKLRLENQSESYDVQSKFAPVYRQLMKQVHGIELSGQKKGSLTDYLDLIDPTREQVEEVLKEAEQFMRDTYEAKAHDAFYDVVATWCVYKFCKQIGL